MMLKIRMEIRVELAMWKAQRQRNSIFPKFCLLITLFAQCQDTPEIPEEGFLLEVLGIGYMDTGMVMLALSTMIIVCALHQMEAISHQPQQMKIG